MKIDSKLLLSPNDIIPSFRGWTVAGVLNPCAIRLPNKKILIYARVAEMGQHQKKGIHCPFIISGKEYKLNFEKIKEKRVLKRVNKIVYLSDGTCRLPTIS